MVCSLIWSNIVLGEYYFNIMKHTRDWRAYCKKYKYTTIRGMNIFVPMLEEVTLQFAGTV